MANESKSRLGGWLKALIGTAAGLLSGATVMYISPLVDRVVKPGRPLANFAVETDGLTATFHNRYAGDGWWDFGDGSPLEPALPQQASIAHAYTKPGTYTAKLLVRNFIGDEHERTVSVDVTVGSATAPAPAITALDAFPVGADRTAPATFRFVAQTTNSERLLWDMGGDRQPEVVDEATAKQEKFVTFATPGEHVIQLTALSGNQAVKRTAVVKVDPPQAGTLVARLRVTDRGTRAEKRTTTEHVPITMSKNTTSTIAIDRPLAPRTGFVFTDAKLGQVDPAFKNLKVAVAQGGKSVQLTGQLTPTNEMLRGPSPPSVQLVVTQERQLKMTAPPSEVASAISLPGSAKLPLPALPADCAQPQRQMVLEIRGAGVQVWSQPVPASSLLEWQGRRYTIKATPVGNEVRIDVVAGAVGLTSREK